MLYSIKKEKEKDTYVSTKTKKECLTNVKQVVMRTIIVCMLKGVLFLVAMLAICVLFGEPNDAMSLCDVIVIKAIAFLAVLGAYKGYMLTLSKRELEEIMNE